MNSKIIFSFLFLTLLLGGTFHSDFALSNQSVTSESIGEIPVVSSPEDIIYSLGDTGNAIIWEIADDNPAFWVILRDGMQIEMSIWEESNETVIANVDGLDIGVYVYEILACTNDYNVSDSVLVTVLYNDLTPHSSFSISSATQWQTRATSEGWSGNGTESNPYIIERYIFDCTSMGIGIHSTSVYFVIRNCTFVSSGVDYSTGINIQSVSNGVIENCTFTRLWVGVMVWFSEEITWRSNIFSSIIDGIRLQYSIQCSVVSNSFYSGGLSLSGSLPENWEHDIRSNQVNGKPLGYFNGVYAYLIDGFDYGQVLVTNSSYAFVDGGYFEDIGNAIQVGHCFASIVRYSRISHCSIGIYTEWSNNTDIFACGIQDSLEVGIQINESANCRVMNCNISNVMYSGILALGSFNTSMFENHVMNCGDTAVAVYDSEFSSLWANTIYNNKGAGIVLGGSSNSFLRDNLVAFNHDIGIAIFWGSQYTIYRNEIGFNSGGNAYDDGSDNHWDDGVGVGNKWSDYGGTGFYYIDGSAGSVDHYPNITETGDGPTISHPSDLLYLYNTTGHYITWSAQSDNPSNYVIYKDGEMHTSLPWSGPYITVNVDGLEIGSYTFIIIVFDALGHTANDSVIVSVIAGSSTTTSSLTNGTTIGGILPQITMIISIGSAAVIIIVMVLVIRSSKGGA